MILCSEPLRLLQAGDAWRVARDQLSLVAQGWAWVCCAAAASCDPLGFQVGRKGISEVRHTLGQQPSERAAPGMTGHGSPAAMAVQWGAAFTQTVWLTGLSCTSGGTLAFLSSSACHCQLQGMFLFLVLCPLDKAR